MMRTWMLRGGGVFLAAVLGVLIAWLLGRGVSHDPNHDIDRAKAMEAAQRVHASPPPGTKMEPGHGG
ncbi:MAG: hypothetical protein QM758_14860 [Armatimonas sp.]